MKSSGRDLYYTITEAAKELGITRAAVHRAIKQGRLEAERGQIIKLVRTKTTGWKISQPSLNSYRVSLLHQWVGKKNSLTVDNKRQP
jgi:excisionase family DNA binding protein